MNKGWSARVCWMEGLRNLRSGGIRGTLMVISLALLLGATTFLDGKAVSDVAKQATEYRDLGGYVIVSSARPINDELQVEGDSSTNIDAAHCHSLNTSPGVIAAGVVSDRSRDSLIGAPGASLSIVGMTRDGFVPYTGVRPFGNQVTTDAEQFLAVSDLVSEEYNLGVGRTVETSGSVSGVVANIVEPRPESAVRSIVVFIQPTGKERTCWIETHPTLYDVLLDSSAAAFDTFDTVIDSRRFVDTGPAFNEFDPSRELRTRPTRAFPFVAGAIGALMVSIGLWTRRSVVGMYRAMSLSWQRVIWVQAAEVFTGIWVAFLLAVSWSTLGLAVASEPTWPVLWFALRSATWALAVCGAGSFIGIIFFTRGSVMGQLKDR